MGLGQRAWWRPIAPPKRPSKRPGEERWMGSLFAKSKKPVAVVPNVSSVEAAWYDPGSADDVSVVCGSIEGATFEADDLGVVEFIGHDPKMAANDVLIFQTWKNPARPPGAICSLDPDRARQLGRSLKGGCFRTVALVVTTIQEGALSALAQELGKGQLRRLCLLWAMSGDDLTDALEVVEELGAVCRNLGLQELSILTSVFDDQCDQLLAAQVRNSGLKRCDIFLKGNDQLINSTYTRAPAPAVALALK